VTHWDEVDKEKESYNEFRKILTKEVNVLCDTVGKEADISVWDYHWTGRNILLENLNENVKIIRGSVGGLYFSDYANNFDIAILQGVHSAGGTNTNPIAHTITDDVVNYIKINGELVGEATLDMYLFGYFNIPVIYVVGDEGAIKEAKKVNPNIVSTVTKIGIGDSVISKSPAKIYKEIKEQLSLAINMYKKDPKIFKVLLPKEFDIEINYTLHKFAYKSSFFPGVYDSDAKSIKFKTNDYKEVLRLLLFCLSN